MRKKKAWNMSNPLYRYLHSKKNRSSSHRIKTREVKTMARRRFRRSRSMGKGLTVKNLMIGTAIAAVAEPFIDVAVAKYIPQASGFDDIIKVAGGAYGIKKGRGIMKGVAAGFMLLGVKNLVQQYATPMLMGSVTTSTSSVYQ